MLRVESLDDFVALLERSNLLSEENRLDLWDAANGLKSAIELADWLVNQRWLTIPGFHHRLTRDLNEASP